MLVPLTVKEREKKHFFWRAIIKMAIFCLHFPNFIAFLFSFFSFVFENIHRKGSIFSSWHMSYPQEMFSDIKFDRLRFLDSKYWMMRKIALKSKRRSQNTMSYLISNMAVNVEQYPHRQRWELKWKIYVSTEQCWKFYGQGM